MFKFAIQFLICNIYLIIAICTIYFIKHLLRNHLSARIQYNLWFLFLCLTIIPFLPFHIPNIFQLFQLFYSLNQTTETGIRVIGRFDPSMSQSSSSTWTNDFTLSVNKTSSFTLGIILCSIWFLGMLTVMILLFRSKLQLEQIKKSSLPLQNSQLHTLYEECKSILKIHKNIPIYSTAFLNTPITVGILRPRIYIPIQLISDFQERDMRYILLHELEHYRYRDSIPNNIFNIIGVLYWFNPVIWRALKEIRIEREVACDSSVLQILTENDYEFYGNTLLNFAERNFMSPFPFASGLGGTMKQLTRRITNIISFQPTTQWKKIYGICIYSIVTLLFLNFTSYFSTYAVTDEYYDFQSNTKKITYSNLKSYFQGYHGSFVLYNATNDTWHIYNKNLSVKRVSPNSTYKVYEGLMGLETDIITPNHTIQLWDGTMQPYSIWNDNQNLNSAMHNSVNWYFDKINSSLDVESIHNYIKKINYGNQKIITKNNYWMESSLKISPVEQVELLVQLSNDQLSDHDNTNAIKKAILLSSDPLQKIYGKTGTGRINGQDINGWFIGFIEKDGNVYYFATNIQGKYGSTGSKAAEITKAILSDLHIWE